MVILLVDSRKSELVMLKNTIKAFYPQEKVLSYGEPMQALRYIKENPVDICFTEVQMPQVSGFAITRELKEKGAFNKVVFMADTPEFALAARETFVNEYLVRPLTKENIERVLCK